jgi:hypothetical protein
MHRMKPLRRFLLLLLLCIGIFPFALSAEEEEPDMEALAKKHMVYVEPTHIVTSETMGEYTIVPYRERRPRWGTTVALEYNSYEPIKYIPNFAPVSYTQAYESPSVPMTELIITVKRNLAIGSFGIEVAGGMFKNYHTPKDNAGNSKYGDPTLTLTQFRVGGVYNMDMLFKEPILVPYVAGGAYVIMFDEGLGGTAFKGNTQPSMYGTFGLAMQLDWIDTKASRVAYVESGVESSFVFIEGRTLMASGNKKDPDFSTDVAWAAGIKVEF